MDPRDAVQILALILIGAGVALTQLPVPCPHRSQCQACEYAARERRRNKIASEHYFHTRKHPDCWRCDEDR